MLYFQIIATETGPSRQSASADVIVNILDLNDNVPVFEKAEYRWSVIRTVSSELSLNIDFCTRVSIVEDIQPGTKFAKVIFYFFFMFVKVSHRFLRAAIMVLKSRVASNKLGGN